MAAHASRAAMIRRAGESTMRSILLSAAAFLASIAPAAADKAADPRAEVLAVDAARVAALLEGDVATLERLTGDELVHVASNGRVQTKAEFIAGQRSRARRFATWAIDENNVRIYGDVAIVTGRYRNAFASDGGAEPEKHARHIRVYVRRGGTWVNVAHQATEIAAP
ncbi:MAG: nuclear transport factor 2 family protein [Hyphomonadaceae bacterium]|nr:nuclear transport factor 2 family protein [Hyphomonadaceae bacterium]